VQFIPRYGRDTMNGSGTNVIWLGTGRARRVERLISAKVDGVAQDLSGLVVYPNGRVVRRSGVRTAGSATSSSSTTRAGGWL
jgi:hypothetical protein